MENASKIKVPASHLTRVPSGMEIKQLADA